MAVYSSLAIGALSLLAGAYLYTHADDEVERWSERHGVGDAHADPADFEKAARRNRQVGAFMVVLGLALGAYGLLG